MAEKHPDEPTRHNYFCFKKDSHGAGISLGGVMALDDSDAITQITLLIHGLLESGNVLLDDEILIRLMERDILREKASKMVGKHA
jgi:hypothetical protein